MSHPHSLAFRPEKPLHMSSKVLVGKCLDTWDLEGQRHSVQVRTRLQRDTGLSLDVQPDTTPGCKVWFLVQISSISYTCLCISIPIGKLAVMNLLIWPQLSYPYIGVTFGIILLLWVTSLSPCQVPALAMCLRQLKPLTTVSLPLSNPHSGVS